MTAAAWALVGAMVGAAIVFVAMRARQAAVARYLDTTADALNRQMQQVHAVVGDVMTLQNGIIVQQQKRAEQQKQELAEAEERLLEAQAPTEASGKASAS